MNRHLKFLFLGIILVVFQNSSYAQSASSVALSEAQRQELISSLNYLQYSTAKIKMSENKAIAEDIYYSIINELKIEAIANHELNSEFSDFLETCSHLKLKQNEKDFIKQLNEKEQKSAYLSAFSNIGSVFSSGKAPQQMVASLVYTSVANAFAIAKTKNQLKTQLEKDMFYLNQTVMEEIYDSQTRLFSISAKLIGETGAKGRINENTMNVFMKAIQLDSPKERKSALSESQLQMNMSLFPPYWYELGNAYQELGENTNALNAYDKFTSLKQNDIVAKDKNYVNLIKNRIQILLGNNSDMVIPNAQKNKNTILKYLDILTTNCLDSEAGERNLYLAKIYYLLGLTDKSLNCLNYIIESRSVYPELIEEAVALKLLIESASNSNTASFYQYAYNYSTLQFGNMNVDRSLLPDESAFTKAYEFFKSTAEWHPLKKYIYPLYDNLLENIAPNLYKEYINAVNDDNLCFIISNELIDNNLLSVGINEELYVPICIKNESDNTSIVFINCRFEDIEENSTLTLYFKSKESNQEIKVNYSIIPVKEKVIKAANKAYERLGSNIESHNAQTAIEFGNIIQNYKYQVDDEEDLRETIRKKVEKEGKDKTKEEINSTITKELSQKLAPDMQYLQERMFAIEKNHYGQANNLYSPAIVQYDELYFLIGITSITDPNSGCEYNIDSNGEIIVKNKLDNKTQKTINSEYKKLAMEGDVSAMVSLGIAYIEGRNMSKNPKEGVRWLLYAINYKESVSDNDKIRISQAFYYLGQSYWNGIGVKKDKTMAKKYFEKSKDLGFNVDEKYL